MRQYQHWGLSHYLREGIFRAPIDGVPAIKLKEVEALARREAGAEWVGYGYKSIDGLQRRGFLAVWKDGMHVKQKRFAPCKDWSDREVYSYLNLSKIKLPNFNYGRSVGVDIEPEPMLYMRTYWPNDYERILKVFPHAINQADRALEIRKQTTLEREIKARSKQKDKAPKNGNPAGRSAVDQGGAVQSAQDHSASPRTPEKAN